MKKMLATMGSLIFSIPFINSTLSCSNKHNSLSLNMNNWNIDELKNDEAANIAIVNGKTDVYAQTQLTAGATPWIDHEGNFRSLDDAYENSFPGNQKPPSDKELSYINLSYIAQSMIWYYEKQAQNQDSPLLDVNNIINNFNFIYSSVLLDKPKVTYLGTQTDLETSLNAEQSLDSISTLENVNDLMLNLTYDNNNDLFAQYLQKNYDQTKMFIQQPWIGTGSGTEYAELVFSITIALKIDHFDAATNTYYTKDGYFYQSRFLSLGVIYYYYSESLF